jgi:hypothetical protein
MKDFHCSWVENHFNRPSSAIRLKNNSRMAPEVYSCLNIDKLEKEDEDGVENFRRINLYLRLYANK